MKSRIIAISVFFILFFGAQVQCFAQGGASVSYYTIVVSEDMYADNTWGYEYSNYYSGNYSFQDNTTPEASPSSVAVSLHSGVGDNNKGSMVAFETELNTEQAHVIKEVLHKQIQTRGTNGNSYSDNDQYLVVLEYN